MDNITLRITGMTSAHCAQTIETALNGLAGVGARVSYDQALARIESNGGIDPDTLVKAVTAKGGQRVDSTPRRGLLSRLPQTLGRRLPCRERLRNARLRPDQQGRVVGLDRARARRRVLFLRFAHFPRTLRRSERREIHFCRLTLGCNSDRRWRFLVVDGNRSAGRPGD